MLNPSMCLVMNVKDEAPFIVAALESVAPYISRYCIVDSGSTDGTQEIIELFFKQRNIQGNIFFHPFKNGGDQRSYVMQMSQYTEDYRLYIDADNILEVTGEGNPFADLTLDAYSIRKKMGGIEYGGVIQLMRSDLNFIFEGVIHEYCILAGNKPFTVAELPGCIVHEAEKYIVDDPAEIKNSRYRLRSHYLEHARILEEEIFQVRPDPLPEHLLTRYFFYLANSYFDAGDYNKALPFYITRAMQKGWDEEVYFSKFRIAVCMHHLGQDEDKVMAAYARAWDHRPQRMEAAFALMAYYLQNELFHLGLIIGSTTKSLQPCRDALLMHMELYNGDFDRMLNLIREKRLS